MDVSDLFAAEKAEIPEEYHDAFDQLVGRGSSPSGVIAAIQYIETPHTQDRIADEYDASTTTIRNLYPAVLALMPEKELTVDNSSSKTGISKIAVAEKVADALGWDEDVHWKRRKQSGNQVDQPLLRKAGWEWLYRKVIDEWEEADA